MNDATILRNESLRDYIRTHRKELLGFYIRSRERMHGVPYGSAFEYGKVTRSVSFTPHVDEGQPLAPIVQAITRCLDTYQLTSLELFFGAGWASIAAHNDALMYLRTGQAVGIQLWILLEACDLGIVSHIGDQLARPIPFIGRPLLRFSKRSAATVSPRDCEHKDAIECLLPIAKGPMFPGMPYVWTPQGREKYVHTTSVGGNALTIGDMLVFKNGVVHRKEPGKAVFRAALAIRFKPKNAEAEDKNFLRWFKLLMERERVLSRNLGRYPLFRSAMFRDLDTAELDESRLMKVDNNDYAHLLQRIKQAAIPA